MIDNYRNNKQSDIIIESYISYYTDQSNLGSKETSKVNNHDRGKQVFGKYNIPNSSSGGTKNKSNSKSRLLYRSGSRSSNDSLKCDYGLKYRNVLVPSATRVGNNNNSNDSTGPINKTNIKRNKTPTNQLNISSARFESRKDA